MDTTILKLQVSGVVHLIGKLKLFKNDMNQGLKHQSALTRLW